MKVYLDHAATTPADEQVLEAMKPFQLQKFGNASSLHQFGREAKEALEQSREVIAKKISAAPEEIIFTSGGSESDNLAIKGLVLKEKRGHIITSAIEHPAVLETCKFLEKNGFEVTYLPVDKEGLVSADKLSAAIKKETLLVSIMHANNEIGTVQDLAELGKVCADAGMAFHSDAVQSFTKEKINVKAQSLALASFAAHKIHGPRGVGALYVREDLKKKILKQVHGGHHESDLRAGTENVAGAVGFAKAVELMTPKAIEKMKALRDRLIDELLKIEETHLNGPREKRQCNNASISFHNIEGESILLMLDSKGIAVSTGSACSSASLEPSHVLTAIGLPHEVAHGTIRYSLGRENTIKEIDYAIESSREVVAKLREMSPLGR